MPGWYGTVDRYRRSDFKIADQIETKHRIKFKTKIHNLCIEGNIS